MSYCPDPECPNIEPIEKGTNCPECGAKSESVGFLGVQDLIYKKRKTQKINDIILFNVGMETEDLTDNLSELLTELATIESAKYPKQSDLERISILIGKIQSVQIQILIQSQLAFMSTVKRLLGL